MSRNNKVTRINKSCSNRARVCVFRSNKYIYANLIDSETNDVIGSSSSKCLNLGSPIKNAYQVGSLITKIAKKNNINKIVFDRNGYKYHGQVKAVSDGMRKSGLEF